MVEPSSGQNIWYMRIRHADADPPEESLVGVGSDEYADGSIVELADHGPWPLRPNRLVRVRYLLGTKRIRSLSVIATWASGAPPLRYVEAADGGGDRPAHTLVAFPAEPDTAGRLDDAADFAELGLTSSDQVAAIRWYPNTGLIHQIYVAPAHRRNRIGTALIMAAAGLRVCRGWPALHADGRRTPEGEAFALAGPTQWQHRVEQLTETMPPMTPGAPRAGAEPS